MNILSREELEKIPRFDYTDDGAIFRTAEQYRRTALANLDRAEKAEARIKDLEDWGGQGELWGALEEAFGLDAEFCDCAADV